MTRQIIFDGTKWEQIVGYARAVRVGQWVAVSGTTATNPEGAVVGVGDAYAQAYYALEKIERALEKAGAKRQHVIRTRMYVTNIAEWEAIARAHQAFFGDVYPAATMVEVKGLIDPQHLVEIEADAIVSEE